jgi:hypothetical protein
MQPIQARFLPVLAGLLLSFASTWLAGLAGCGTIVETTAPSGGGNGGAGGASTGTEGPPDAQPDYIDPGCPDAAAPPTQFMCDPFHQDDGECQPAEGCYIFAQASSDPCGGTVYGASCEPAGTGTQGAPCGSGSDCAAGFSCVVTGAGIQCIVLCQLQGTATCPSGLVCQPIDVQGFGGCL